MTLTRRCRLLTVLLSLCALLFAQTALAAYACPAVAKAAEIAQMAEAGMPCAESPALAVDDEQPGLCHAHCRGEPPSADHYQLPALATLDQLGAVLTVASPPVLGGASSPQVPLLRRGAAPPLAVRYCCFRI